MDINELITVCAVDDWRNYANAAYDLSLSVSVVSKHIKKVETELGVRIFERATKGKPVELTEEGNQIIGNLHSMVEIYRNTLNRVESLKKTGIQRITIGYLPMVGTFKENEIMTEFSLNNPDVLMFRRTDNTAGLINMLVNGIADGVFIQINEGADEKSSYFDSLANPDFVVKEVLSNNALTIGLPEDHPLANEEMITRDKFYLLGRDTFLFSLEHIELSPKSSTDIIEDFLGLKGIMKKRYVDFTEPSIPLSIVEKGMGVMAQTGFTPRQIGRVHFVPVEGADRQALLYFVYRKSTMTPAMKKFVRCVADFSEKFYKEKKGKK